MNRVKKRWVVVALVAGAVLTSVGARADMIVEMDNADTSTTVFGAGCFLSTFRILYQGDNYLACEGVGGAESRGLTWDMANAPRESGGGFFYENGGLHCIYAKWADGAARWNNTRYQIDWNFGGSFVSDTSIGVDQQRNGGQWVRLACSTAPIAGSRAAVRCSNFGIPAGRYAICDGIKVVREQVDGGDIIDGTVTGTDIANGTVTGTDIASSSVPSTDLSNEAGGDFASGEQNLTLTPTDVTARSVAVTAPSSGKVMVSASGYFDFNEQVTTDRDVGRCSITTGTTIDFSHLAIGGESGLDDEIDFMPFAATRAFNVSAGTTTYRLVCDEFDGNVSLGDSSINAVFVPTTY